MDPITKNTTVAEAVGRSEGIAEVLQSTTGSECRECPASEDGTLELYALLHGLDLDELLDKLNAALQ